MPGIEPLLDAIDPILLADHPENVDLWLPSALSPASQSTDCIDGLPRIEFRLRYAQAMGALHEIRLCRRLIRALNAKTQAHITNSQKTSTRTRSVFDKANSRQAKAAATYRVSRKAIESLAPSEEFGPWKTTLLELKPTDIRGPGREPSEVSVSRFVQSWIWVTAVKTSICTEDPDLNTALRVEWCKGQERAKRYEEEVELVVEEMRRTLVMTEFNAQKWDKRATTPLRNTPGLGSAAIAGAIAYAYKQADVQRKLVRVFLNDWYDVLLAQPLANSWLSNYSCPFTDNRHRLVSNAKLYHSTPQPDIHQGSQKTSSFAGVESTSDVVDTISPNSSTD